MARFGEGEVVVIPFPFADLSGSKRRPAFVIATLPGNDILLCQITSKASKNKFSIPVDINDFATGSLPIDSYIRPNKIFTADQTIIIRKAGTLKEAVTRKIIEAVVKIVSG